MQTHRSDRNRDRHHIANGPVKFTGAPDLLFRQKTGAQRRMLQKCLKAKQEAVQPQPPKDPLLHISGPCTGRYARRWKVRVKEVAFGSLA